MSVDISYVSFYLAKNGLAPAKIKHKAVLLQHSNKRRTDKVAHHYNQHLIVHHPVTTTIHALDSEP